MGQDSRLPTTLEEFTGRYIQNEVVDNPDTTKALTHVPCMFCGAPDMMLLKAMHVIEDLSRGGKCNECGRGIVVVFGKQIELDGAVPYEVFQTEGADPPEYMEIWPRRVT